MPISALPDHLKDIENHFPDDSQFGNSGFGKAYRWINKKTKTWFAFSYRCTEWWARWRKYPKVLLAIGSKESWRLEGDFGECHTFNPYTSSSTEYLSRIQYQKRWHFSIQWPLLITFHFYPKAKDVPNWFGDRSQLDGKVWFAYWNHYDADNIFWMVTSMYLGRNFK